MKIGTEQHCSPKHVYLLPLEAGSLQGLTITPAQQPDLSEREREHCFRAPAGRGRWRLLQFSAGSAIFLQFTYLHTNLRIL